jgi:hypothetical protein
MNLPANLSDTTLPELIQTVEISGRSCRIQIIRTDVDERASIYFSKGQVIHAHTPRAQGEEAIWELFSWARGRIVFNDGVAMPPQSISKSNSELIVHGLRISSKINEEMLNLPPMNTVLKLNTENIKSNEKLQLDANEWNFLILVDGKRTLKEILTETNLSAVKTVQLISKLLEQKVVIASR